MGQRHYCRTDQRCCERPRRFGSAALVGVNPVYGLYTSVAAPIGGSLPFSTQLMQIATTSASALAAGQGIASYPLGQRDQALFLLVLLTGVFLVMFGVLRLGRLVRFVSHAVMIGRRGCGSSVSAGPAMAAAPVGRSTRYPRRNGQSPRALRLPPSSPTSWSPNTAIICRSTRKARSLPGRASSWTVRRSQTGSVVPPAGWSPFKPGSPSTSALRKNCSPTIH